MAVRIRWEIVRTFSSKIRFLSREPSKLRFDLQTCLNNIFSEAEFRGTYSLSNLLDSFDSEKDKEHMQKIIDESDIVFAKIWRGIGFDDPSKTFGDISTDNFAEERIVVLDEGLNELKKINREFLEMAPPRAEALIRKDLGTNR